MSQLVTAVTPKMSNQKPKWAKVLPINLEFNMSERLHPSIILNWDLKEEINSIMLFKQIHKARKSPINVKRLKSFHMNVPADKPVEIKIRISNFLTLPIFIPLHRILLAIGSMNAKIITKGVSETL